MGTRWDEQDYWPELDYARPPARRGVDWAAVSIYAVPIICWTTAILLVLIAKGWV